MTEKTSTNCIFALHWHQKKGMSGKSAYKERNAFSMTCSKKSQLHWVQVYTAGKVSAIRHYGTLPSCLNQNTIWRTASSGIYSDSEIIRCIFKPLYVRLLWSTFSARNISEGHKDSSLLITDCALWWIQYCKIQLL